MIRKAVESDINAIADTYNDLLTYEENMEAIQIGN